MGISSIVSYPKGMQHHTLKSIQDAKGCPVCGQEDEFAVVAELDPRPFTGSVVLKLEGCKGTLLMTYLHLANQVICLYQNYSMKHLNTLIPETFISPCQTTSDHKV